LGNLYNAEIKLSANEDVTEGLHLFPVSVAQVVGATAR
jgi:hypothetical protein